MVLFGGLGNWLSANRSVGKTVGLQVLQPATYSFSLQECCKNVARITTPGIDERDQADAKRPRREVVGQLPGSE